jgi:hypothetical protein
MEPYRADDYGEFSAGAIAVIDAMYDRVNELLARPQQFLGGTCTLGADDIMFAAHSSWLFFPEQFGAGTCARFPTWDQLPQRYRGIVQKWKEQPAGQLVMQLYKEHRDFGPVAADALLVERDDDALYPGAASKL